jgi:hypothetical protein
MCFIANTLKTNMYRASFYFFTAENTESTEYLENVMPNEVEASALRSFDYAQDDNSVGNTLNPLL